MKKFYLSAIAAFAMVFTANAQLIDDDLENYSLGEMGAQNPTVWSVWSGTPTGPSAEDLIVSDAQANSGSQSGFVGAGAAGTGGPQDVMLLLGNQSSGDYTLQFQMFIPSGKTGYFNIQGETTGGGANGGAGSFHSPNLVFNNTQSASGAPGLGGAYGNVDDADALYTWSYPENQWFPVTIYFDVDGLTWDMTVAGDNVGEQPFDDAGANQILGGIDFFAIDANNEYYIDDVLFVEGELGVNNPFAVDSFRVYPNPVQNELNIKTKEAVENVTVYDVLGKVVLQASPEAASPKINMSALPSGVYMVQVTIGNSTKTVKVLK